MAKERTYQINHMWIAEITTYSCGLRHPKQKMSTIDENSKYEKSHFWKESL